MKTWIKKHATWANLFFALAWAYASAGVLHLAIVGFDWWTLADVVAYSTLLWLIASESKQEAMCLEEVTRLTNQNQRLKEQLETYTEVPESGEALSDSDKLYRVERAS